MAKTLKEIDKEISKYQKSIEKYNKKEEKDGSLSNVDAGARSTYRKMLKELEAEKENILNGGSKTIIPAPQLKKVDNTPASTPAAPTTNNNSLEKGLEKVEEKAEAAADEMNSEEEKNNKTEDAKYIEPGITDKWTPRQKVSVMREILSDKTINERVTEKWADSEHKKNLSKYYNNRGE